jgi:hypothetical protein
MAASDNVLNVGFTPDKNSTSLVAKAITAQPSPVSDILLKRQTYHKGKQGNTTVYATPFEEFSILRISGSETLEPLNGPGIASPRAKGRPWRTRSRPTRRSRLPVGVCGSSELGPGWRCKARAKCGWRSTMGMRSLATRLGSSEGSVRL